LFHILLLLTHEPPDIKLIGGAPIGEDEDDAHEGLALAIGDRDIGAIHLFFDVLYFLPTGASVHVFAPRTQCEYSDSE